MAMSLRDLILEARDMSPMVERSESGLSISREELDETRKKMALAERLETFTRSEDITAEFSVDATKRIVWEMEFGKTSNDRRKAAEHLLDREKGKPVNRQVNVNMSASEFSDVELKNRNKNLLIELKYVKGDAKRLVQSVDGGETVPVSDGGEGPEGSKPT